MTQTLNLEIYQFPCRTDNFGLLVHDPVTQQTISIDSPEEGSILEALAYKGWHLTHIFNTHHHYDHVDSNLALKKHFDCKIIGSKKDAYRIPGLDIGFSDKDIFLFGLHEIHILETPGHTSGHLCYWFPDNEILFTGDTLFSMGCGRIFEGDAAMMWRSLQKIMTLPPETIVYCAHEYTKLNGQFALQIEPGNTALQKRMVEVEALRKEGKPTLPICLQVELNTNPFLRPDSKEIQKNINMEGQNLSQVFKKIRTLKDKFR